MLLHGLQQVVRALRDPESQLPCCTDAAKSAAESAIDIAGLQSVEVYV
jgi:hypothetical protein